jgi:hypothetical protein
MGRGISHTLQLPSLYTRIIPLHDDPYVCALHHRRDPSYLLCQKRLRLQLLKFAYYSYHCPNKCVYPSDNSADIRVLRVDI